MKHEAGGRKQDKTFLASCFLFLASFLVTIDFNGTKIYKTSYESSDSTSKYDNR